MISRVTFSKQLVEDKKTILDGDKKISKERNNEVKTNRLESEKLARFSWQNNSVQSF